MCAANDLIPHIKYTHFTRVTINVSLLLKIAHRLSQNAASSGELQAYTSVSVLVSALEARR